MRQGTGNFKLIDLAKRKLAISPNESMELRYSRLTRTGTVANRLQLAGLGDSPVLAEMPRITTANDLHPGHWFENLNLAGKVAISKTLHLAGFPLRDETRERVSHCGDTIRKGGGVTPCIGGGTVIPHVGPETDVAQCLPARIGHDKTLCAPLGTGSSLASSGANAVSFKDSQPVNAVRTKNPDSNISLIRAN